MAEQPTAADPVAVLQDFLRRVAGIPLDPTDLSYTASNTYYARGSLAREVRKEASTAIYTLEAVIIDARNIQKTLAPASSAEGVAALQLREAK